MGRSFTEDRHQADIVTWLRQWGATAEPLHLGDDLIDVARVSLDHDLFVLKSRSDLAMSVAADLHGAGARVLNPYPVSALLRDRVVTFRVLRAAGVPVPETFAASHASQLLPALDRGPLIVKPYRRYKKHRPEVVTSAAELAALAAIEEPVFAQRYHPPDGPDRMVYSIGSELFGVLRGPEGAPFALSPELVDIARRCGAALGIDLFGVNVVESAGRAYVVDMSSVPAFRGVPDAARRVAKYVLKAAERAACGEPVVPAELQRAPGRAATRALKGSSLQLVLGALSGTEATPQELAQIESVVDDIRLRSRAATSPPRVRPGRPRRDSRPTQPPSPPRVAMYSQGMVGFGHIRRNASIAQALRACARVATRAACWGWARCCTTARRCDAPGPTAPIWTPSGTSTTPYGSTAIRPCSPPCASTGSAPTWRPGRATRDISTSGPASTSPRPGATPCWRACPRARSRSVSWAAGTTAKRWPGRFSRPSCPGT